MKSVQKKPWIHATPDVVVLLTLNDLVLVVTTFQLLYLAVSLSVVLCLTPCLYRIATVHHLHHYHHHKEMA